MQLYQRLMNNKLEWLDGWVIPPGTQIPGHDVILPNGDYQIIHRDSWICDSTFYAAVVGFALGLTLLRVLMTKYLSEPICRKYGVKEQNWQKFTESCMQTLYYTVAWIYNTAFLMKKSWLIHPIICFLEGFPRQEIETEIFWFYALSIGWYLHCVYAHFYMDSRKSDHIAMLSHHAITLILLYATFSMGYFRIGMVTLFSMDVCDIFLHGARILKYLVSAERPLDFGTFATPIYIAIYGSIPLSWLLFRLVYFPIYVMGTTIVLVPYYGGYANAPYYWFFNTLLVLLFFLQVWWFGLIVQVGLSARRKGNAASLDDVRDPTIVANKKHKCD